MTDAGIDKHGECSPSLMLVPHRNKIFIPFQC